MQKTANPRWNEKFREHIFHAGRRCPLVDAINQCMHAISEKGMRVDLPTAKKQFEKYFVENQSTRVAECRLVILPVLRSRTIRHCHYKFSWKIFFDFGSYVLSST